MEWRHVFAGICGAIEKGQKIDDAAFDMLERACGGMSSEEARIVYEDLCKIQLAHEGRTKHVVLGTLSQYINLKDVDSVDLFHATLVANGRLCERVADCIELPIEQRLHKWKTQRLDLDAMAQQHRIDSEYVRAWSTYLYESRHLNKAAYERVRARLEGAPTAARPEWQSVVLDEDAELAARDKTFWYAVQTGHIQLEEKRAVMHRFNELKHCAGDVLHRRTTELYMEIFYDLHRQYRPATEAPQKRRCVSLLDAVRRLTKRTAARLLRRGAKGEHDVRYTTSQG